MSSPAQILANQSNAQHSTGPATKLGLSTHAFIRADEQEEFEQFKASYTAELCPQTLLEETFAREIVHAAWRLRRCAMVEENSPEGATEQELDRLQSSVDRTRSAAHRSFHRSLAELRRVQTERVYREIALPSVPANPLKDVSATAERDFAKQTQSRPVVPINVARNAPCPCGSREKYKRCCGKTAPPVLGHAA